LPAYEFTGLTEMVYPESRDANRHLLGVVTPGDIRFFDDGPPDHLWSPAGADQAADGPEAADPEAAADSTGPAAGQDEDEGTGASEGDAPDPEPQDEPSAF